MALDSTVGGSSSNSYVSVADADSYFDDHLNVTAWTANTDKQEAALVMATRRLEDEFYQGEKAASSQALQWPRINATDKDGEEYGSTIIPDPIKFATYELALRILNDDNVGGDFVADTGLEEFKRAKVGELEVEVDPSFQAGQLPREVRRIIRHVLTTSTNSGRAILWAEGWY